MNSDLGVKIGLEIHVQMTSLKTKLFCSCSSDYRSSPPNTNVCPVCLGLPGALPVVNAEAIKKALAVAIALKMDYSRTIYWARKHYFYPDLPKNYQITQYEGKGTQSFARNGRLEIEVGGRKKVIRIRRINIEEDPGRIVYPGGSMTTSRYVLVDYNRSGIALLEIVTEPDFNSAEEVIAFLKKLRSLLEHLDVADFSLEGSMRADVNISVGGGCRVEVKNIGSISEIERAILYEVARQKSAIARGEEVRMETRHWDPERRVTVAVRVKETEEDYKYMPDPNLPPIEITDEMLREVLESMPELPEERMERYVREYGLPKYLASVLVSRKALCDYFDAVVSKVKVKPEKAASYIVNDLLGWIPEEDPRRLWKLIPPEKTIKVLNMLGEGRITIKMAKEMIPKLIEGRDPEDIVREMGWEVIRDENYIRSIVLKVVRENPRVIEDARRNKRAIQYIIGRVLEETGKKADPRIVYRVVREIVFSS